MKPALDRFQGIGSILVLHCSCLEDRRILTRSMKPIRFFTLAASVVLFIFPSLMRANPTPAERVAAIQKALQAAKLDGWLFYDFRKSDPLAPRILMLGESERHRTSCP